MYFFEHVSFRTCKFSNLKLPKEEIIPETELTGHKKAAHITWDAGVTVQAHLKLDVFLYAGAYKNRSFTALTHSKSVLRTAKRIGIVERNVTCTRPR